MKTRLIGLTALALGLISTAPVTACPQTHDLGPCVTTGAPDRSVRSRAAFNSRYANTASRYANTAMNDHYASAAPAPRYTGRDGRPGRWCGWYMRQRKGVADRTFNLARNWTRWGSPTQPQAGAIVVWRSHVGEIVSYSGGCTAVVHSGNDGGGVRTRERNICNAIAFRA